MPSVNGEATTTAGTGKRAPVMRTEALALLIVR
jgi:hypothetical protein